MRPAKALSIYPHTSSSFARYIPGPSSTLSGFPVRSTGSPTVTPEVSSYTWIVALSASIRMTSDASNQSDALSVCSSPLRTADKLIMPDTDEFKCFFAMAQPYPSRNTAMYVAPVFGARERRLSAVFFLWQAEHVPGAENGERAAAAARRPAPRPVAGD